MPHSLGTQAHTHTEILNEPVSTGQPICNPNPLALACQFSCRPFALPGGQPNNVRCSPCGAPRLDSSSRCTLHCLCSSATVTCGPGPSSTVPGRSLHSRYGRLMARRRIRQRPPSAPLLQVSHRAPQHRTLVVTCQSCPCPPCACQYLGTCQNRGFLAQTPLSLIRKAA